MKILLLTYHYPPDRAVGALRPAKVARAFRDAGHDVVVITSRPPGDAEDQREGEKGLQVRTVRPWRNPRELYAGAKRWWQSSRSAGGVQGSTADQPEDAAEPVSVPDWKRWIFSLLWLPDDRQGFIPPALRAAREEMRLGVDLIYTTAPPFSVHLAGYLLSRSTGVRWAAEFRDPWTENPWKPWHGRSRFSDNAEKWLERKSLAYATDIIAVTQGIGEGLARKVGKEKRGRVQVVLNGIDRLYPARPRKDLSACRRIVHVGTLYHARDPRPFLDALVLLRDEYGIGVNDLQVVFVGHCRWFKGLSVEGEIAARGLQGIIELRDWVPREEVQEVLLASDVLLLLAQQQPDQVPNKLYEYLGTRTPILAYADEQGETARMLRRAGEHFVITDENVSGQARIVAQALELERSRPTPVNEHLLREWTAANQMKELLRRIEVKG